jgi:hypothetical protein
MASFNAETNDFGTCRVSFEGAYRTENFCFNSFSYSSDYNAVDFSYYIGEELIESHHRFTEKDEVHRVYL